MDNLPNHLVGQILSLVGDARTVMNSSATSRTFQDVVRNELDLLRFELKDWNGYYSFTSERLEICLTGTVVLTNGLRSLIIQMNGAAMLSDSCVVEWLLHTRETLKEFSYSIWTAPNLNNVLVNLQALSRLEVLALGHNHIAEVPYHLKLNSLKSLSLTDIIVSSPDLTRLVSSCGMIEVLNLDSLVIDEDGQVTSLELHIPTLVEGCFVSLNIKDLVLMTERLERLLVKNGRIQTLNVGGKNQLHLLKLDAINSLETLQFDGMSDFLEVVDIRRIEIEWSLVYAIIGSSKLIKNLSLLEVNQVNFEAIAAHFPLLKKLSVTYPNSDPNLLLGFQFENLQILELQWRKVNDDLSEWVKKNKILKNCIESGGTEGVVFIVFNT